MRIDLTGRTALVTGSTGGIGQAIAKGLAAAGAATYVNGRSPSRVDHTVSTLKAALPTADIRGAVGDVATAQGCAALVAAVPSVDILVNNAGIFEVKAFFEIPDEDWSRFFETNVMSGVRLSRAYMPGMLARNWGRIIFIASESAVYIPQEMIHYGFTKAGQLAVSRGLAELTAGTSVTVNAVLPGPTRTEGVETFLKEVAAQTGQPEATVAADFVKTHRATSLIQRFASVEEIANMAIYLASPQASATNGAAMRVEGGIIKSIV